MKRYKALVYVDWANSTSTSAVLENDFCECDPFVWRVLNAGHIDIKADKAFPELRTWTRGTSIHFDNNGADIGLYHVTVDRTSDNSIEVCVLDDNNDPVAFSGPIPVEFCVY